MEIWKVLLLFFFKLNPPWSLRRTFGSILWRETLPNYYRDTKNLIRPFLIWIISKATTKYTPKIQPPATYTFYNPFTPERQHYRSLPALFPSMKVRRNENGRKSPALCRTCPSFSNRYECRGYENEKREGKEENRLWYARCIRDLHSCRRVHLDGDVAIRWHKDWLQGYRELSWQERRFSLLHPPPSSPLPLSRLNPPRRSPSLSTAHSRYLFAFSNAHRWQRPRNPPPLKQLIDLSNGVQLIQPPDLSSPLFLSIFPKIFHFFSSPLQKFSIIPPPPFRFWIFWRFWKGRGSWRG